LVSKITFGTFSTFQFVHTKAEIVPKLFRKKKKMKKKKKKEK